MDDDDASFKPTTSPTTKSCTIGKEYRQRRWRETHDERWAHRDRRRHRRRARAQGRIRSAKGGARQVEENCDSIAARKVRALRAGALSGAFFIMLGLPLVVFLLYFGCNKDFCVDSVGKIYELPSVLLAGLGGKSTPLWSWQAVAVVFGWTGLHFLAYLFLPGPVSPGVVLRDGSRLKYHINAHLAFWLSLASCHLLPMAWLYDHFVELATAAMALSVCISVFCYALSFRKGEMLAEGGVSGNVIYDFYIGRALNPRVGLLDLKCACELRPGLIGWVMINIGMAFKQAELIGYVSWPMILVNVFQALYVWDALFYEQAILTTMDITTDGFGFMLAFGDLAWVPFTYSVQARVLVDHDPGVGSVGLAAIVLLNLIGYAIFRGANSQKDAFRRDPNSPEVAHLEYIETKRGSRLLVTGWWGMARKINYTGDWLMGLAWCLCAGSISVLAYFYSIYFFVLLVHRAARDDHFCATKYGDDWAVYKKKVPAIFIPKVI